MDYLEYIYKMSIGIYSSVKSLNYRKTGKEKILKLTAKIMEKFPVDIVEKIYKPKQYLENLLNEIRLSKLTSTIKGGIWSIIGILIGKFSILLNSYKIEVHDVIFADMNELREVVDELETVVPSDIWPYPTYGEILYSVK